MDVTECLLIVIGLSLNVFLEAEYEGTMLKKVHLNKLLGVCGIFFLCQMASILGGYYITAVSFLRKTSSEDLKLMCYILAFIIFLILAVYMLRKAWKKEIIQEHLSEIKMKRVFMEAAVIAFFTFLAGIGYGFLGNRIGTTCLIVACATVLAVITGIYTGFYQGCKFRTVIYSAGGIIFLIIGINILVRHL